MNEQAQSTPVEPAAEPPRAAAQTSAEQISASSAATSHHRVLVVGGGSGGLSVASRLARRLPAGEVTIVEPSEYHYYQPLWTLVAAGMVRKESTRRPEARYIPRGARWLKERVIELLPHVNRVRTPSGTLEYDYLVLAPGIQLDWRRIAGLPEALGKDGVCSIYDYTQAELTWNMIREFRGGTAVFTMPPTPIKCAGAPQKIMYLAEETFRSNGVRDKTQVIGAFGSAAIFGIPLFRDSLERLLARRNIDFRPKHELIAVDPARKIARFRVTSDSSPQAEEVELKYDLLHVVPPQSAPDFIKHSPLATTEGPTPGWAKVDKYTLRSPDFPNVFALGDASSLPTSRTGAAVRKQAPVLVNNLLAAMQGAEPAARYDGYASCPLLTTRKTVILAEFDYEGKPTPTFPGDPSKERRSMYLLKRHLLPLLYWNGMLRGRA